MKKTKWIQILILFILCLTFFVPSQTAQAVTKLTSVNKLTGKKTIYLAKGKKATLKTTVTVTPNTTENKAVTYKSSNKKIATVTNKGIITAKKAGTVKITVTSKKNKKKKATITVKVLSGKVTGVKLNKTSGILKVGETDKLKATITVSKGGKKNVVWTSSNTKVAKVNNGTVTAVSKGTATITVKATDGTGKKATYKVTVKEKSSENKNNKDKEDNEDDNNIINLTPDTEPEIANCYMQTEAKKLLGYVNTLRKENGLNELEWNNTLENAAMYWSKYNGDVEWRHPTVEEANKLYRTGEIIARISCTDAEKAYTMWYNSIGHRANMLGTNKTHMGASIYYNADGVAYAVIMFGDDFTVRHVYVTQDPVTKELIPDPEWLMCVSGTDVPAFYKEGGEGYNYIHSNGTTIK